MNNDEAAFWLSQFIGKTLRVHASDGRIFGGQMKCTDKVSKRRGLRHGIEMFRSSQKHVYLT